MMYKDEFAGHYQINGMELQNVYIMPKFRGKGFCKKLVQHATLRKKHLHLWVKYDNLVAKKCYKGVGFVPTSQTKQDMVKLKHYI